MANLVGRTCDANAGAFEIGTTGGKPPALDLSASGPIKGASVVISDSAGKPIRTIAVPDGPAPITIQWDGRDGAGGAVAPGSYTVAIKTTGSTTVTAAWHGQVDALELTANGPRLRMGDMLLSPGDITTIGAATALPSISSTSSLGALP
jgi:flagellar hook assembly protein FlgD